MQNLWRYVGNRLIYTGINTTLILTLSLWFGVETGCNCRRTGMPAVANQQQQTAVVLANAVQGVPPNQHHISQLWNQNSGMCSAGCGRTNRQKKQHLSLLVNIACCQCNWFMMLLIVSSYSCSTARSSDQSMYFHFVLYNVFIACVNRPNDLLLMWNC